MDLDDTGVFELSKAPDQERAGQPGGAGGDVVERAASVEDVAHDDWCRAVGGALSGSRALAWPARSGGHVGERLPASRPVTDRRTRLLESGSRVVQPATPNLCASSAARRR